MLGSLLGGEDRASTSAFVGGTVTTVPWKSHHRGMSQVLPGSEAVLPLSNAFGMPFPLKFASVLVLVLKLECTFLESRDHTQKEAAQLGPAPRAEGQLLGAWLGEGSYLTQEGGGLQSMGSVCGGYGLEEGPLQTRYSFSFLP